MHKKTKILREPNAPTEFFAITPRGAIQKEQLKLDNCTSHNSKCSNRISAHVF